MLHRSLLLLLIYLSTTVSAEDVDVVVVGGGLAGIAAAREYAALRPDHTVVLLEAKPSLGGRVHSEDMFTLNGTESVDLGAQWISPSHADLIQLVRSVGLTLESQTMCGERKVYVEESQRRVSRSTLDSSIPFEQVVRAAELQKFSGQSVQEWIHASNLSAHELNIVHRLLQTVLDAPPSSVSALQLHLMASSEGRPLGELLQGQGHGEGMRIKEGLKMLISKFSSGVDVRLSEPVLSLIREDNGTITVRSAKKEYSAKQVIVAVPPSIAASIHFIPPLPHQTAAFLQSYAPVGHAHYFAVTYNHAWWRANNISGETVYGSAAGPLTWMTTFDTGDASQCGSCGSSSGVLWGIAHFSSPLPSGKRREAITKALVKTMVYADAEEDIIDFKDYQFSHDEYLGGTMGVLHPSTDLSFLLLINNTISHGPIHFASAELSRTSMGLMNGAILSGKKAAHAVDDAIDIPPEEQAPSSSEGKDLFDSADSISDLILSATPSPSLGVTSFAQESTVPGGAPTVPVVAPLPEVQESIDAPRVEGPLRDSPVQSTTPFIYTTSTFYPPSTPPHPLDSTAAFAWKQGDFDYKTSTQYPPPLAPASQHDSPTTVVSKDQPMEAAESHDAPPTAAAAAAHKSAEVDTLSDFEEQGFEYRKNRNEFDYHTSTQYPPLTTTVPALVPAPTPAAPGGFDYSTSTQYPPQATQSSIDRAATVAGQEEEEAPAKMAVLKNEQMVPNLPQDISGEIRTTSGAGFNYSTSTQYPPTGRPVEAVTPLVHFSAGNAPDEESKIKEDQAVNAFSADAPVETAAIAAGVTLHDPVPASGEKGGGGDTVDRVARVNSAMQTLEKEVPQLPKEESAGIGDRLLELLHKILSILKGGE